MGVFFFYFTKEDDAMKLEMCMKYECKNCKNKLKCFKEERENNNGYSKYKHKKSKRGIIQSKKKPKTRG